MNREFALLITSMAISVVFLPFAWPQEPSPAGGGWLQLDGIDSFAMCPDNDSLDKNLQDFTLEVWIYPNRKPERDEWWIIAAKPGSYELAFVGPNDGVPFITEFGITFTVYKSETSYGIINTQKGQKHGPPWFPNDFNFKEWHHVTASFSKPNWALYLDGKAATFGGPTEFSPANTPSSFYVGGIESRNDSYFDGVIDEVRISDVARPIKADTKFGRFKVDRATLALWHFNEPEGAILYKDSTGNGNILIGKGSAFAVEAAGKLTTTWARIKSKGGKEFQN
jgi:hypothetical protein